MALRLLTVSVMLGALSLWAQDVVPGEAVKPNNRVEVPDLPKIVAADNSAAEVAKAAVAIVLSAYGVTCERNSQVNSVIDDRTASSLRSLSGKVAGSTCEQEGRLLRLTSTFVPNASIHPDEVIHALDEDNPILIRWKGDLYVLWAALYDIQVYSDGHRFNVIRELLLIDPRYSDVRRFVSYKREKAAFTDIEGIAFVGVAEPEH